jgi:hypothetical protein
MPHNLIVMNEKKFMWDGIDYESTEQVSVKIQKYKADGFEVEAVGEDGKTALYTRRVVKGVVVQNA